MNRYDEIEQTLKNHRSKLLSPNGEWPRKVKKATNCIHDNLFAQKLKVGWVMKQCYVRNNNFSAKFAHHVGKTPKQYIVHHRIAAAKKLLSNTGLSSVPIATIAFEIGFSTASGFSTSFKQRTGLTPSQWREENSNIP